jgi:CubicO group peptidase (beta-lactamase class C family)
MMLDTTAKPAETRPEDPATSRTGIGPTVQAILNRHPAVGLAVGVVGPGGLESFHGHGLADIERHRPVTVDTGFRIASITKTFTAIAVMQLWERELIDLNAPADDYLHGFRLVSADPTFGPPTVRHLLTHTSGIPENVRTGGTMVRGWFAESVPLDAPIPSLSDYYQSGLPIDTEPGTNFKYTNHGYAALGAIVEEVSGLPLDRYFREKIFEPLGMAHSDLARSGEVEAALATGYKMSSRGPRPLVDRHWVTAAASSIYSTPADMACYLRALLSGGAGKHGRILEPSTLAIMFAPHYRPDHRLPGMGLGFFRVDTGGHPVVEHQGILPGFNSQVFVAPDAGKAVMAFTNGSRQAMFWLPVETGRMLGQLIGAPEPTLRLDLPHHPEIWSDLCGRYRVPARITDVRLRAMLGAGAEVLVRGGRIHLRLLTPLPSAFRGFPLVPDDPDDPYAFRIDLAGYGLGTARVVFGQGEDGRTSSVSMDLMPLTLRKAGQAPSPRESAALEPE